VSKSNAAQPDLPVPKKRKWRRRFLWLAVLAVVARIALAYGAAPMLGFVVGMLELDSEVESIEFDVFAGEARLYGLSLWHAGGDPNEPIVELEYASVDIATLELLRGNLIVRRVEADGLDLYLTRDEFARWNVAPILEPLLAKGAKSASDELVASQEEQSGPVSFDLPFVVEALRGTHLRLHLDDALADPPLDTTVTALVRLTDLGHNQRATHLSIAAAGPQVLDVFELESSAAVSGPEIDASLDLRLRGLRPGPLAGYLELVGVAPTADRLDADARIDVDAVATAAGGNHFTLSVAEAQWRVDGTEAFALDSWTTAVGMEQGPLLHIEPVTLSGARATAAIDENGNFGAGGFAYIGKADSGTADPQSEDDPDAATETDADAAGSPTRLIDLLPFALRLDGIEVADCSVHFVDHQQDPPQEFALLLDEFHVSPLNSNVAEQPTVWSAGLQAPGLLGTIQCEGSLAPFAGSPSFRGTVDARGADLAKLAPYLESSGFESRWVDGRASADVDLQFTPLDTGNWSIDFGVRDVRLAEADSEQPWFALSSAGLQGLVVDPGARRVELEAAQVAGVRSITQRLPDGGWLAFGFSTLTQVADVIIHDDGEPDDQPRHEQPEDAIPADVATSAPRTKLTPWRVEVGRLSVDDTSLSFIDESMTPPVEFHFDELGASIDDLAFGGDSDDAAGHAQVRAFLREPGLADSLELSGVLNSQPDVLGIEWDLQLIGEGLAPIALEPYLDRANMEVVDATSAARAKLDGSLALDNGGLVIEARVADFAFGPVDAPFVSATEFKLGSVNMSSDEITVDELTVKDPVLQLGRRADGALLVAGLRIGGRPDEEEAAADGDADSAAPDETVVAETESSAPVQDAPKVEVYVEDDTPTDPFAALDSLAMQFELGHFAVEGARLKWRDEALESVLDIVFACNATVDGLALRPGAAGASFALGWHIEGEQRAMQIEGNLVLDPRAIVVDGKVIGEHLDFERISPYFPPNISATSLDARFESELHAELIAVEEGGRSLLVECSALRLTEADVDAPVLSIDSARLHAPRIDGTAGEFEVAEVTTSGVELRVHRDAESRWHVLGLVIDPSAKPTEAPAEAVAPEPEVRVVSRRPVAADSNLPRIQLGTVDVGIDRLILTDDFQAEGAAPLVIGMRASTPQPQLLMSDDPGGLPPYELRLSATLSPLIDELAAELELAPFSPQPSVKGKLSMRGLDGHGVIELLPQLAEAIDSEGLAAGQFDGTFEAVLDARRRGLTKFEFKRGFGIDLYVTDLAFRAEPDGEVLLGLASLEVKAPRINTARQEVVVQRIELVDPRARFARDANGVHALGLVIDPVALQAALESSAPPSEGEADVATAPPAPAETEPQVPSGEIRIDELLVSGLDFDFEDRSYDPPFHLPLTGLSVEVSRFTTRMFTERVPLRINTYVEAGVVDLGEGFEPAPLFQEATLAGQVSVYPDLGGWIDAGVSEFALRSLRGPAKASGVTISNGAMDSSLRVRLRGERGMTIDTKSTFRDLSVSEPSDGPIKRFLGISMPLESALFALRKSDGEIVLEPPSIRMSASGISTAEIARVATTVIAKEITLAVARSPLRLTKGVADTAESLTGSIPLVGGATGSLFGGVSGLFGGDPDEPLPEIGSLDYLPGDVNLLPGELPKLQEAIHRLRDDKQRVIVLVHEFTTADLERAMELANPSEEDCRELVTGLRQKKAELFRIRDEVTADARARLLTGQEEEAAASVARLRAIDAELGRTEVSLDQILELLQPGAERRRENRGRKAAMAIAEARLEQIVAILRGADISKLEERLEVRRPRPRPVESEDQADQGGRIKLGVH
jgi:uncharacterized protein DUF748